MINLCSKTNEIYTGCMHFQGFFRAQKAFVAEAPPRTNPSHQEADPSSSFWPRFWAFKAQVFLTDSNWWLRLCKIN